MVKIITQNSRQQPDLELILPELDLVSRFVDFLGIPNRPTTQQGMGGMRLNTAAGLRKNLTFRSWKTSKRPDVFSDNTPTKVQFNRGRDSEIESRA